MDERVAGTLGMSWEGLSATAGGYALTLQGLFAHQRRRPCVNIVPGMAVLADWSSNLITPARPLSSHS